MKSDLAEQKCVPCSRQTPRLTGKAIAQFQPQLGDGWKVVGEHHLEKDYAFKNFKDALDFVNRVGAVAEQENHHPDIFLTWGKAKITIWTHAIDGLSENDFILAVKADTVQ
jgi:4a-hydroxytetrahydrobiopterin dehydratase